jgi:hypothetical protein
MSAQALGLSKFFGTSRFFSERNVGQCLASCAGTSETCNHRQCKNWPEFFCRARFSFLDQSRAPRPVMMALQNCGCGGMIVMYGAPFLKTGNWRDWQYADMMLAK